MKDLLSFIVKSITASPEEITVSQEETGQTTKFIITAPKEQIGGIIGQKGRIIKAIRTLLAVRAKDRPFLIEIKEA